LDGLADEWMERIMDDWREETGIIRYFLGKMEKTHTEFSKCT
jgi:hypothetical protein